MSQVALRRISSEFNELSLKPAQHCSAPTISNENLFKWIIHIYGPEETVYAKGKFKVSICFTDVYPFEAPNITFLTKIYHCNIGCKGNICLDILKDKWSPAWSVATILLGIVSLLSECNAYDPLVYNIGREYLFNKPEHDRKARLWTKKYAK